MSIHKGISNCCLTIFCFIHLAFAQSPKIKALKIGDRIPDLSLKMINYSSHNARISDFRGRLLILDFWFTGCSVCIAQFAKMEKIQQELGNRVMILPVTNYRNESFNLQFFANRKKMGKPIGLPSVVEADTLFAWFPGGAMPHEIWIDPQGRIIYMTDELAVSKEVIVSVLKGDKPTLPRDFVDDHYFRGDKPILVDGNGGDDSLFIYRSIITRRNKALRGRGFEQYQSHSMTRLLNCNRTVYDFYKILGRLGYYGDSLRDLGADTWNKRLLVRGLNLNKFKDWKDCNYSDYRDADAFQNENLFTYEVILPPGDSIREAYRFMDMDISRFFKVCATVERKNMSCLALMRLNAQIPFAKSSKEPMEEVSRDNNHIIMQGQPIRELVNGLNSFYPMPYVVDETENNLPIDIIFNFNNGFQMESLIAQLKNFNLTLVPVRKNLEILVIRDQP